MPDNARANVMKVALVPRLDLDAFIGDLRKMADTLNDLAYDLEHADSKKENRS